MTGKIGIAMATSASSRSLLRRHLQSSSPIDENYSMINGKIVVASLVICFFIVFLIIIIRLYARSVQHSFILANPSLPSQGACTGLDKGTVEALPVFTYNSQSLSKGISAGECVVCLSDFRQDEKCKLLPKCNHYFHSGCIDVWFLSNTTCPLCRKAVEPSEDGEAHDVAVPASSCSHRNTHQVTELREQYQVAVVPMKTSNNGLACDDLHDDGVREGDGSRDALLNGHFSLQPPVLAARSCRRSISEKLSKRTPEAPLPNYALLWGNHAHTPARTNPFQNWQIGGRSFSHTIDMQRCQESSVAVSSCSTLQSSPTSLAQLVHNPTGRLKSLKRFASSK